MDNPTFNLSHPIHGETMKTRTHLKAGDGTGPAMARDNPDA